MNLAHVLRASALLRADLDALLQHSLVTAIKILTEPLEPVPAVRSCNFAKLLRAPQLSR